MAENISEIMSGLACIRGGLSVISENTDNINELVEEGEKWKQKVQARKDEYDRACDNRQDLSSKSVDKEREIENIKDELNALKRNKEKAQAEYEEAKRDAAPDHGSLNMRWVRRHTRQTSLENANIKAFPCWQVNVAFIVAALVGTYIYWYININNGTFTMDQLYWIIIPVNLIYPVACILLYCLRCLYVCIRNPYYKEYMQFIQSRPLTYQGILSDYDDKINAYQRALENALFDKQEIENKIKRGANSVRGEIDAIDALKEKAKYEIGIINDKIRDIRNNSIAIKQALAESYKDLISPADWQHIDVIMYYLETHRADSIKEALNIIDSKLQFEQLTNVITSSAEAVCGYIQSGFIKLNNNLIKSHEIIMDKLDDIEYKVDANRELIGSTAQVLARGIDRQISEAKLNNALVKKAHKQIGELLNDMEFTTQVDVSIKV